MSAAEILHARGELRRGDSKSYRQHAFRVPAGTSALRLLLRYDRGGDEPHGLVTLQLFDPYGFRGAGHRFAPQQAIEIAADAATPGFLAGALPAGEWLAELDLHCVIEPPDGPARYELRALAIPGAAGRPAAARGTAADATPGSRTGAGPRRWLRGELHLHSDHSDGRWDAREMAHHARGRGLDFLFLTDHNTHTGVAALRAAVREALGPQVAVQPGIELTTFNGHALALGLDGWVDWRTGHAGRSMNDVALGVRRAGGFLVVAHPEAPPDEVCTGCRWTHADFDPALAGAVEVWGGLWDGPEERNEGCLALWRRWLDAGHRLTATGATDAHRPEDWHGAVPLTYLEAEDASLGALLAALGAGRSYVSCGPELSLQAIASGGRRFSLGESAPGDGTRLEARCASGGAAELRLVSGAGVLATAEVSGEGRLEADAPPAGSWCCGELWEKGGARLLAVTSPIYFRRG